MKRLDYNFKSQEWHLCDIDEVKAESDVTIVKRIHTSIAMQFIIFMECQDADEFTPEYMTDLYQYWLDAYVL